MRETGYRKRVPKAAIGTLATAAIAMSGMVMGAPASYATPSNEWSTSFEEGEPQIDGGRYSDPENITGERARPGSLLRKIVSVAASGENAPNETKEMLADGDKSTKWLVFSGADQWVSYTLDEPASIASYTLTSGGDAPERDPKHFRVEASNDGTNWETIDEQTNASWNGRGATNEYELGTPSAAFPYWRIYVVSNRGASIIQIADWELFTPSDDEPEASDLALETSDGPTAALNAKTRVGFTGLKSAKYSARHLADGPAKSEVFVHKDVNVALDGDSELSYKIFPTLDANLDNASTFVGVDLLFNDGSRLSESGLKDIYGYDANAKSWGGSNLLVPAEWNSVRVDVSSLAGKTVKDVIFVYDNDSGSSDSQIQGWLDDVSIAPADRLDRSNPDGLVSFVDTRRGTNASGGYSRGLNIPAVSVPNGFNFVTPMTQGSSTGELYKYHKDNNVNNRPALVAIGVSHETSIWMGDRNQLAVMPSLQSDPSASFNDRRLSFSHDNETARPDIYEVTFDNGLNAKVTPDDHSVIYHFDFGQDFGSVILDQVGGQANEANLNIDAGSGAVTGWVDHGSGLSVGRSRMFVYGVFDQPISSSGAGNGRENSVSASFTDLPENTVELRLATSLISQDQAQRNLELEVAQASFDQVKAQATKAWNKRLGVVTVNSDASDHELVTLYSNLYRLNMYPNSQHENTGSADSPVWMHASPVAAKNGQASDTQTNAAVVEGKIYVNNGFWDTYRTAWPLYSLLYPEIANELIDGFVQQYREGGWISRWSSPGYANLMTGTSSDVSFAEAYITGALDPELALEAYQAALRNATVLPVKSENVSDAGAVGRKGIDTGIFLGYTSSATGQSVSWGMEGFINDFGLGHMAEKLSTDPAIIAAHPEMVGQLKEEAAYFQDRATNYVNMFNPEVVLPNPHGEDLHGAFASRNASGSFEQGEDFDIKDWGGAYTEGSGWTFAYHAFFDVDGMAALYSKANGYDETSNEAILATLDAFFGQPDWHSTNNSSGIHEAREARDVRIGMLGISNQIAYHIPYIYAAAGRPSSTQEIVREVLQRIFQGADIGQGYIGDEDNGAYSSWYVFSALGFYPRQVGSGEYTIGSPLFDSVTLWKGSERELTLNAPGTHAGNIYVAGVNANGTELSDAVLPGELVRSGGSIDFAMSATPTSWGERVISAEVPQPMKDVSGAGLGTLTSEDATSVAALVDNTSRSTVTFSSSEATLVWKSAVGPVALKGYTITSGTGNSPSSWTLEGSNDNGLTWTQIDSRSNQSFTWQTQTRPFMLADTESESHAWYRLVLSSVAEDFSLAEIELFGAAAAGDLTVSPASTISVRTDQEISDALANISGGSGDFSVELTSPGISELPSAAVNPNGVGGWHVTAPGLRFAEPGVYDIIIAVTDNDGGVVASEKVRIEVQRVNSFDGSFTHTCITDIGAGQANCDGQGWQFGREDLVTAGYRAGETVLINGLHFALPAPEPGTPDHVTDEGQDVYLDIPEGATQLALLGTATESKQSGSVTVVYSDGTQQQYDVEFADWVGGAQQEGALFQVPGRYNGTSESHDGKKSAMYMSAVLPLLGENAEGETIYPVKIVMPKSENGEYIRGRMHIFAYGTDVEPVLITPLDVVGADSAEAVAGEESEFVLANASGGSLDQGRGIALVNWGDGSALSSAQLVAEDGVTEVQATHRYAEAGEYEVAVVVDDGRMSKTVYVPVTVKNASGPVYSPAIEVPASILAGETFAVIGVGFAPGENVTVSLGGGEQLAQTQGIADSNGNLPAVNLTVPTDTSEGTYPVEAIGNVSQIVAQGQIAVTVPVSYTPTISVPAVVAAGDALAVDGSGFASGESVTVSMVKSQSRTGGEEIVTVTANADANGAFSSVMLDVPQTLEAGDYTVIAVGAQSQIPVLADVSVTVPGGPVDPDDPDNPGSGGNAPDPGETNKPGGELSSTGATIGIVVGLSVLAALAGVAALRSRKRLN